MISLGWGVITVDLGVITFINRVACGLSGWKQENLSVTYEDVFEIRNGKTDFMLKPLMQAMRR
jgi:PAS domain-containing protein